jgi:uncharacterized protein
MSLLPPALVLAAALAAGAVNAAENVAAQAAAAAVSVSEIHNPRGHGGWVSDMANLLPDDVEARLNDRLAAVHRDLGVEIAVAVVADLAGDPQQAAAELLERWDIGKAGADDGLLVLLVGQGPRLAVATGKGLDGRLPAGWLASVRGEVVDPALRGGASARGLEAGLAAIDARLRSHPGAASAGAGVTTGSDRPPWRTVARAVMIAGVFAAVVLVRRGYQARRRRRAGVGGGDAGAGR